MCIYGSKVVIQNNDFTSVEILIRNSFLKLITAQPYTIFGMYIINFNAAHKNYCKENLP